MPLLTRIPSEFLFRRFILRHYASDPPLDMNLEG